MDGEFPLIDFAAMERDLDEEGCVSSLYAEENGFGAQTDYARLQHSKTYEGFVGFFGDYQDRYIEIRVPNDVLRMLVASLWDVGTPLGSDDGPQPAAAGEVLP